MILSPEIAVSAEKILSASMGEMVQIKWGESVIGYPHVHRGKGYLPSQGEALPVILKFPQKPDRWLRLCNDWAGCRFLNLIPDARDLCPHLFGGDSELRFTLYQEVEGITFTDMLTITQGGTDTTGSREMVRASFGEFGRTLGQLHSVTHGRQTDYEQIRKSTGPMEEHVNFDLPGRVRATHNAILGLLHNWYVSVSDPLIEEIDSVIRAIEDAQPYLAYTHIDLNPNNLLITPSGSVRIIDFDSGSYRHVLLDGVWCRMGFPGHAPAYALSPELLAHFENTYRLELSPAFGSAVEDDDRFSTAVTDACAFWTLIRLGWLAEATFEANPNQERITHLRRQLIVVLDRFACTVRETGKRPELGRIAETMLAFAQNEWGNKALDLVHSLPVFPREGGTVGQAS